MPVLITAKINGFRRCGIGHSDITMSYPDDRFTAAQLAELQAEPLLVVTVVSEAAGASQSDDSLSRLDALTAEISRLTNELAAVTPTLDTVTAERDTLKKELAELNKEMKKNAKNPGS
ncbi:conserved hypothetical protein [Xenorhabdus bovienii str. oregonense]|uniref:Mu-like prophage FluMu N-terminal domain-containing protein n=1 Tax=Xenorhabdus bovienii str. oregonense TaxID=1398202 RepID=A0A077P808_XENBV|nr:HI1506-related protein [Xenorhabdus bovienii]CDH07230.1 conserved hypothetical protein [Xenorhabdus bovienii str. oregonense]